LQQALAMPLAERRSRQESMLKSLRANSISDWHESFVSRLVV
jgi:trehalose-6-phosphate synthase